MAKATTRRSAHDGGYRAEHRTRGVMVNMLDNDKLTKAVLKVMAAQYGTTAAALEKEGWQADGPFVIARDSKADLRMGDRDYAIVCTEGVGWGCDEAGRIGVPVRCGWASTNSIDVGINVILKCMSKEQVDLADFVRSFGDRLETNFSIWFERFSA